MRKVTRFTTDAPSKEVAQRVLDVASVPQEIVDSEGDPNENMMIHENWKSMRTKTLYWSTYIVALLYLMLVGFPNMWATSPRVGEIS